MKHTKIAILLLSIFAITNNSYGTCTQNYNLDKHNINSKDEAYNVLHKVLHCIKTEVKHDAPPLRSAVYASELQLEKTIGSDQANALLNCIQGKNDPHAH